ncbi:hypothetical protein Q6247_25490, partial [Klebsiella pneumoniae]
PMNTTFPNSFLRSLPKPTSDHTPLQLSLSTSTPKTSLFRFENAWLKHPSFLPFILPAWHGSSTLGAAAAMVSSLKAVRCVSKSWARRNRRPLSIFPNCKFVIYLLDVFEEIR